MSDDTAAFTGSIPEHYDHGLGPIIFADYAADMAARAAAGSPARVLETAAGTGIVTRRLRDLLPAAAHLTATDLNPPMLEVARTKFRQGEQVEFQPADAMALPFADGSFDTVVCQFGVMFYPDKDTSYREVRRVLVPGGRYLFSVWDSHRHNPFGRIGHEVAGSFFPVDPPQFLSLPFSYPFDPIKDSLTGAGFTDITAAVVRREKEIPDAAAFARGLICGNPLVEQIRARGGDPERIVETLAQAFRREFGADPGRMPLQAIMFSARKPAWAGGASWIARGGRPRTGIKPIPHLWMTLERGAG
jgi:SAM-dependent methyltransferase